MCNLFFTHPLVEAQTKIQFTTLQILRENSANLTKPRDEEIVEKKILSCSKIKFSSESKRHWVGRGFYAIR